MEPIIRVENVKKAFNGAVALKCLTFDVAEGEIFGFLGPSGAGKTTTIKLLTRQLHSDAGELCVFSKPVRALTREDDDRIGVLSDNSGVYERLSVWDNLSLFAALRDKSAADIEETLAGVGLLKHRDKRCKVLSRGMRQRLTLAQAVLHKPRLLFLDEPTASLDPATSSDIHKLLLSLNGTGTTIFLTTHNMEEADKLCGRVAFLNLGEIVELGEPDALKLKYANGRVRATLTDGEVLEEENTPGGLRRIAAAAGDRQIARIRSMEPDLEEIFLKVTGRNLT